MLDLNAIARTCQRAQFWATPYDTGNLARSVTDLRSWGPDSVGYIPFTAEYGAILNEVPVIHYRLRNPTTGQVYEGSYENRHYHWLDDFAEQFANDLPINFPNLRRVG